MKTNCNILYYICIKGKLDMIGHKKESKEKNLSNKIGDLKAKAASEAISTGTTGHDISIDPGLDKFKGKEYQPAKYKELEKCTFTFSSAHDSSSLK